ncbi:hypothetical protein D3C75_595990 [compost metagenome]
MAHHQRHGMHDQVARRNRHRGGSHHLFDRARNIKPFGHHAPGHVTIADDADDVVIFHYHRRGTAIDTAHLFRRLLNRGGRFDDRHRSARKVRNFAHKHAFVFVAPDDVHRGIQAVMGVNRKVRGVLRMCVQHLFQNAVGNLVQQRVFNRRDVVTILRITRNAFKKGEAK